MQQTARLALPGIEFLSSYLASLAEGHTDTTDAHLQVPLAVIKTDPEAHLTALNRPGVILRLPDGTEVAAVPGAHLWLVEGDELIGRVSLRYQLTQRLLRSGGNIGYGIRPSRRCQGYGHRALALAKQHMRERGLDRVLLTCADDNAGSARIIEAGGGVLENITPHPDDEAVLMRRYWIEL